MNELKSTTVYDAYWKANSIGEGTGVLVYLKSEADKVIAEKDKKIAELNDKLRHYPIMAALIEGDNKEIADKNKEIAELKEQVHEYAQGLYVLQARAEKEARHHKYKRCLAMAYVEWLKQMILCNYTENILYRRAVRRERKWKELAEQFKED